MRSWGHTFDLKLWSRNTRDREHRFACVRKTQLERSIGKLETLRMLNRANACLPVKVTLTRIAPKPWDEHDNLSGGFKHLVDGISDALGFDDAEITWAYAQKRGKPREYGVRILIEEVE